MTSISDEDINTHSPQNWSIQQNYPNPFNPETTIRFELASKSYVKIIIYNILGQKIVTLLESYKSAGRNTVKWDGKDSSGLPMSSGLYLYKIITDDFVSVKKMSLIR